MAELKETINAMVDRLSIFAECQVTRVALEVGTEGWKLGGKAEVDDVEPETWKRSNR